LAEVKTLLTLGVLEKGRVANTVKLREDLRRLKTVQIEEVISIISEFIEKKDTAWMKEAIDMVSVHSMNMEVYPPVNENKVLWHIIDTNLIPIDMRQKFERMVFKINRDFPELKEKVILADGFDAINKTVVQLLEKSSDNIIMVGSANHGDIKNLPVGVLGLVFSSDESGVNNFANVEYIIATLRALYLEDVETLLFLYNIMTGAEFSGSIEDLINNLNNPKKLAKIIQFKLRSVVDEHHKSKRILTGRLFELVNESL